MNLARTSSIVFHLKIVDIVVSSFFSMSLLVLSFVGGVLWFWRHMKMTFVYKRHMLLILT